MADEKKDEELIQLVEGPLNESSRKIAELSKGADV
jgi:hypothetical protein